MLRFSSNKGLTVAEILISSAISILVIIGIVSFYLMAQAVWIESNARISLQRDVRTAMEKMVRGIYGGDGIREATAVDLPNSFTINYTSGIDDKERSFYFSDGQIWHDPDRSVANNEFSVVKNVQTFSVSNGNLITINLVMQDILRGKALNVFLYTQVELRN